MQCTHEELKQAFEYWRELDRSGFGTNWIAVIEAWRYYCKIRDEMGYMPQPPSGILMRRKNLKGEAA